MKKSVRALRDRSINKSTAFTREEREEYGVRGLLPYAMSSQEIQVQRVLANMRRKQSDIEKYIFLSALQSRNERLYYKILIDHIDEVLPIVYTPTVGQACREFSHIYRLEAGFFITPEDKGHISRILDNWPEKDIRIIVVTDGQRVLGLGDLGANGMGIPIGKLALYVAGSGIHPHQCLPVMLDVGTNNEEILNDMLYLGYPHRRIIGDYYLDLVDEFVMAVQEKYPKALIQFEDFLTPNAYTLLEKYRHKVLCFNDDIQGTASVALAGVLASTLLTYIPFKELRILFLGAGSAATGIADLMVRALEEEGLSTEAARHRLWFVDIDGLVVAGRKNLMKHNLSYAHEHQEMDLLSAIEAIKPQVLIGASGSSGAFSEDVITLMSTINKKPVIFALSNPTSKSECTATQAYEWSKGHAIFASGSPFGAVEFNGQQYEPGQGNNAYIFPAIGLGAIIAEAKNLPESIFLCAAKALAREVTSEDLAKGKVYPDLKKLRSISLNIAIAVVKKTHELGIAKAPMPDDLKQYISDYMYDATY